MNRTFLYLAFIASFLVGCTPPVSMVMKYDGWQGRTPIVPSAPVGGIEEERGGGSEFAPDNTPRNGLIEDDVIIARSRPHCAYGIPTYDEHDPERNVVRVYPGFTVYYDDELLGPRWTAVRLTKDMVDRNNSFDRDDDFYPDPLLRSAGFEVTEDSDYDNPPPRPGEDEKYPWARGHMVGFDHARGYGWSCADASFYTSNVWPQIGNQFNGAAWRALEARMGKFAKAFDEVWVFTGPIFDGEPEPFAEGRRVPRPTGFFKVAIAHNEEGHVQAIAFVMPHEETVGVRDWRPYVRTVDCVQRQTGIDFMPDLEDDIEKAVETTRWERWLR